MIEIVNEPGFDFGSPEYRAFFSRFGLSPFQHPDWLAPFDRLLPAASHQPPLILVARDSRTQKLRCVLPLLKGSEPTKPTVTYAFLGVTDYACPVVDPAALGELSLVDDLVRLVGDHALNIGPIHDGHRAIWKAVLGVDPTPLHFGSHAVVLSQPISEWRRTTYGRNLLSGIGRKARRLAELGEVRLELLSGRDARSAIEMARAFRAGRFADDPLQVDPSATFYADVAASVGGLARTFRLTEGGRVVAVMFGLAHLRRFHYLVLACDYPAYAKYSPGLLIMDLAIEAWAAEGGTVFDFTIGDEPFKAAFGCTRTSMYVIERA